MNLLVSQSGTNHLRATAARQFCTNYARKYRFRILSYFFSPSVTRRWRRAPPPSSEGGKKVCNIGFNPVLLISFLAFRNYFRNVLFYVLLHSFLRSVTQNCVSFSFLFLAKHIMLTPSAHNRMLVFLLDSAFYSYGSGDNAFC
jgi:hypothetical protein